jgi:type IV pilus assembly protein PilW
MSRRRQAGVGLIEVLISASIGLLLVVAAARLYVTSTVNRQIQSEIEGLQQNARHALGQLVRDTRRSGYFGGSIDLSPLSGTEAPLPPDGSCSTTNNSWGRMLQRPLYGIDDGREGYDCIPGKEYLRGDLLVVRYADPLPVQAIDPQRLYLKSAATGGRLFAGRDRGHAANSLEGGNAATRTLVARAYYIRQSSSVLCPDGSRPPSLYREYLGSRGLPLSEEIAAGIENLQIQYGVSSSSGDSIRLVDADGVEAWDSVVLVQLWLLARQECAHAGMQAKRRQFGMGSRTYVPANPAYHRELFQATVMLRNPAP